MSTINDINDDLWPFQQAVTAMLMGNPATRVVPFTAYRKLLIESVENEALAAWKVRVAGKVGIACLVMMPSLRIMDPNVPGPQYELVITIRTLSDPRVNNTTLTHEGVAMSNARWLDGHIFEGITQLHGDHKEEALKPNYDYPGLLVYDTVMSGPLPQDYLGRTEPPSISADDLALVTISGIAAGAAAYYTTDGTEPMPPANEGEATSASIYSGPFGVAPGATVKALAWDGIKLPSHTIQALITAPDQLEVGVQDSPPQISTAAGKWRRTEDGRLQCYDPDTGRWHTIMVAGDPPQVMWDEEGEV